MILSLEQMQIVFSDAPVIFIEALAGTGKTTTLAEFSKERSDENILYLVFNSKNRKEARFKFPKNVTVHTINSFVFNLTKNSFTNHIINEYSISFLIKSLPKLKALPQDDAIIRAVTITEIINSFFDSPLKESQFFLDKDEEEWVLAHEFIEKINNVPNFPLTHNVLLKKFLDTFNFNSLKYDTVLVDEAQDLSLPMLNIINKINAKKVFVGDIRQAIYGFRRTVNVFTRSDIDAQRLKLTKSYRFGSEIAAFVNAVCEKMYKEPLNLQGASKESGELVLNENVFMKGPYSAFITRTNAYLFDKAFSLMKDEVLISIPFDWDEVKSMLMDVFYLKIGLKGKVVNKKFKDYENFEYMKKIAQSGGDVEISYLIKVVEKYGLDLPENISTLERYLSSPKKADIILLTAHKSKGLEFFDVELGDDFPKISTANLEEKNLIYVAMTRAMERLKPNKKIKEFLHI